MPIITMLESIRPSGWDGPFAERVAREHHLADDLARRQVAHQPHRAGVAEAAVERAADLARDAERAAVGVGDEHHLVIVAVAASAAAICGCRRSRPARPRSRAGRSRSARRARRAAAWRCRSSPRNRWRRDCRSGARAAWRAAWPASRRGRPRSARLRICALERPIRSTARHRPPSRGAARGPGRSDRGWTSALS